MDLMNLSADAYFLERYQQSEELGEKAHVMIEHVLSPGHARSIYVDNSLGAAQVGMGHYAAAMETFKRAVATARRVLPPKAHMLGQIVADLARQGPVFMSETMRAAGAAFGEAMSISTEANDPGRQGNGGILAGSAATARASRRCCADTADCTVGFEFRCIA